VPTKNFPHPNIVDAVAFHPTAAQLATGCHDGKVRFFDLIKGAQLREINAHPKQNATMIYAVAFSSDGKLLASCGFDNSVKLWATKSGALVREIKAFDPKTFPQGHQESVFCLAFSSDNKFLASGSGGQERLIKIWSVADGKLLRELDNPNLKRLPKIAQSHPGWVYSLRFSRDGKRLVSAGDAPLNKGYLAVWGADDGKLLRGVELPLGSFYSLALSPDDQVLAVGAGPRGRPQPQLNCAYLLRIMDLVK
jgi:WD40 repeat protein